MKRLTRAIGSLSLAFAALNAQAADVSHHGVVVSYNDTTHGIVIAPEGWQPPMLLPPERPCDEATYVMVKWLYLNEQPAPHIWLVDTDPSDGIFDAWGYYN